MAGVYPVLTNQFEINTDGRTSPGTYVTIADMETFSPSMDGDNVENWTPMDTEGWQRNLKTGKGVTISISGKRNVGDAGNDYVAGMWSKNGQDANSTLKWTMIDGTVVSIPCVVNVKTPGGGDSTNVDALEADFVSDGKPTLTAPTNAG